MQSQFLLGCSTLSVTTIGHMGLVRFTVLDAVLGSCALMSMLRLRSRASLRLVTPRPLTSRRFAVRAATATISLLVVPFAIMPAAFGQTWHPWHRHTPRDTVFVPANQSTATVSHNNFTPLSGITADLYCWGTFSALPGQTPDSGFDAAYLYRDTAWNAPFPLKNPPMWPSPKGTSYNIYLSYWTSGVAADERPVSFIQPDSAYQPSHYYTSRVAGATSNLRFRIYDRVTERGDPRFFYGQNQGGITIAMAQHTADISVQYTSHSFGTVDVGSRSPWIDSIGSCGVDPLKIDSIRIDGPDAGEFSVISEDGDQFALPNEGTNEFRIIYTPTKASPVQAVLHIYSSNAYAPDRVQAIQLTGAGAAPQAEFGTTAIDFNRVRVHSTSKQNVVVNNFGNGDLRFDSIWIVPGWMKTAKIFLPPDTFAIAKSGSLKPSLGLIPITFTPAAAQKYSATAFFRNRTTGQVTQIALSGEGAMPIVKMDNMTLDFGTVRSYGTATLPDTLRNSGNWTGHITYVGLQNGDKSAFSFTPPDTAFLLNAGEARPYLITFNPGTLTRTTLKVSLVFYFDNADTPLTVTLIGREEPPQITYDTLLVNFGNVEVEDIGYRSVGLNNASAIATGFQSTISSNDLSTFNLDQPAPPVFNKGRNTMQLSFHPHRRGPASGWLHIRAGVQTDSIFMYGFATQAFPIFDPPVMDYGIVPSGANNYQLTELRDTGDAPLQICSVDVIGDGFTLSPLKFPLPCTIPPDGMTSKLIGVYFTTNDRTGLPHYGRLEIHYCNGRMDTVQLIAKEQAQHVQYTESPVTGLDFGKVHVGVTALANAGVWNGSNVNITIDSIWITPLSGPFATITKTATVSTNSADSNISISFEPPARGRFSAMLHAKQGTIWQDSIPVFGTGVAAIEVLSPDTVNIAKTDVGLTSGVSQFALSDTGDWPLQASIVKINDLYNEFLVTTAKPDTIDATPVMDSMDMHETHLYSVTFSPKRPLLPDHEAQLVFSFDDGTMQIVTLIGHDRSGFLAFDKDTLNFGKVRIGAAPVTMTVGLANTSDTTLTATALRLPNVPFASVATAPISVDSATTASVPVTFTPTKLGLVQDSIVGSGRPFVDSVGKTVILTGIGAAPVPHFSSDTVDFGVLTVGTPGSGNLMLSNVGNWPLSSKWTITGPNAADFASIFAADTTISENDNANVAIHFLASTPLQYTPRTATLTFTLDDDPSAQFSVVLIARDKAPLQVPVSFGGNFAAHAGDYIFAYLRLGSSVPDSIGLQHIHGTITYDPSIIEELKDKREQGSLVPSPLWKVTITDTLGTPGSTKTIVYDIQSRSDTLRNPGALLKLTFRIHDGLTPGAQSELVTDPVFPDTKEAVAITTPSVVQLDSLCGQGHFTAGEAAATFIEQNTPNPFGSSSPTTFLPFDVGSDNTQITIRILNASGREIYRPLDKAVYAHGHYSVPLSAKDVGSGSFFYEFEAQGQPPQVKKMSVQ
ncbi:MAG: choice-of-anchor D domain-containing protein [Bacteroidota bacterium]|nr:choice-of-anchor D domain-containing protein [Bacteroidota bacterium]MDP4233905.1 choice-of-anchor D domain-containing protein [Bacteroidota bacterium]MDP4242845.1 choice-of-anchor D domain-containing protein [Bacteroidota bacterium]MDP4288323.1 choice-of-anchor D domain-containing protein [Bacteroidota bacterium]